MIPPRVGVTGGRDYADADAVADSLFMLDPDAVLVHGAAPGADTLCAEFWESLGRSVEAHPADWDQYGRAAGPLRNKEMLASGLDLLVAFPGGRGTAHMTGIARAAGVPVIEMRPRNPRLSAVGNR